jgi:hypothetical protein
MIGLVASHFSRNDDGIERELLCLNFNFAFKAPVFAEQELLLSWRVASVRRWTAGWPTRTAAPWCRTPTPA